MLPVARPVSSSRRPPPPPPHLVARPTHRRVARPARRRRARPPRRRCARASCPPPSISLATLPSSQPPFLTLSWAACHTSLQAPFPPPRGAPSSAVFCTTSSFSPHPIRLFTLLLLSSFLPPFRAFPPFLHFLPLRICHLAACY
ncbi:unnamed protein product [Closterium sp. Naga37s-1]|nr:unnamed protein product [Closterium sp. Naga37s-1]